MFYETDIIVAIISIFVGLFFNPNIMPNFLNGMIHFTFLALSIITLRDIKMKT